MDSTPSTTPSILSSATSITLKHYKKLLSYSLFVAFVYASIAIAYRTLEPSQNSQLSTLIMAAWLLWIPILSGYCHFQGNLFIDKSTGFKQSFISGFSKIIPIFGAVAGILILPALLVGVMACLGFLAVHYGHGQMFWPLIGLGFFLSLLLINRNLLSIVIVSLSNCDSMQAISQSVQLTKHAYLKTMFRSTLAFILLLGTYLAPIWIGWVVELNKHLEMFVVAGVCFDIVMVTPFFWGIIILDLHHLEHARIQRPKPKSNSAKNIKHAKKAQMQEDDWF